MSSIPQELWHRCLVYHCNIVHTVIIPQTLDQINTHAMFVACLTLMRGTTIEQTSESGVEISVGDEMEANGDNRK